MRDGNDIGDGAAARVTPALIAALRAPEATRETLQRIAGDSALLRYYEVKKALVGHPRTPLAISRNLVGHLRWGDLADAARSPRPHPIVRRDAERYLRMRVRELSSGERVALARRATRGVIPCLLESAEPEVLRSLLGNGQVLEAEVANLAAASRTPGPVLATLAAHHRWSRRRPVRLALLRNSRTPVPAALRVLEALPPDDLRRVARSATVPRIVRVGAERRLQRGASRPRALPVLEP